MTRLSRRWVLVTATALAGVLATGTTVAEDDGLKTVEAKLVDIPGEYPSDDDPYDYAFVMKYEVLSGDLSTGKKIFVAHFNPTVDRDKVEGKARANVKGSLKASDIKKDKVHKLQLDPNMKKRWRGATIDEYFATDRKSTRYWAYKADLK